MGDTGERGGGGGSTPSPPLCPQALPYVALLIAMIFFIYAVIGMQVRAPGSPPGTGGGEGRGGV